MDSINLIKALYHFFAFILLAYVSFISTNIVINYFLRIIALIHLYDTWWFLTQNKLAPI
jgi:hypothetical protein